MVKSIQRRNVVSMVLSMIFLFVMVIILSLDATAAKHDAFGAGEEGVGTTKDKMVCEQLRQQKYLGKSFTDMNLYDGGDLDIPTVTINISEGKYSAYAMDENGVVIHESNGIAKNIEETIEYIYDEILKNN